MEITCPLCQHVDEHNTTGHCSTCGGALAEHPGGIEEPLRMLGDLGRQVAEPDGFPPGETLEHACFRIVDLLHEAVEGSRARIDANMGRLRKEIARNGSIKEEEVDLKSFHEGFHSARTVMNEGIGMALGALMGMRASRDLQAGEPLEPAIDRIQEGYGEIRKLESFALAMELPAESMVEVPASVITAMDFISRALESLNGFMQSGHPDEIRTTLSHMDQARHSLAEYLGNSV